MPSIRLFGRRFNFASDDLTIPSLIDIILRLPLLVTFIIFRIKDESPNSTCPSSFYNGYFYPLLSVYIAITISAVFICFISTRGSPLKNIRPRRHMPLLIYIRLFLVLIDIGINIMGSVIIIRVFQMCAIILRATIITTIVLSWSVAIALFIILAFFIDVTGFVSAEKKWEMRIRLIFCCGRGYGGQSSDIKNIVKTLQYLFDDERFDLVPSDVAAGLILLQQEDAIEERSVNIIQNVPLELLKEGLYYNTYAQSAFGWFSLAYQYRLTFILRMLFATNFRTIGFCCGCCTCCASCCGNQDSVNDPCGNQYSTLRYLLRRQNPIILYANFHGAFHRAPFYIAADNEKKTIIVSIRGTLSATDVLTDINAVEDVLETELFGSGYCHSEGTVYSGLALDKLFAYSAELTSNKNVSALAWNHKNSDLLAVGYGPFEYNDQRDGLVCCWSLKNQDFPERYFHTPAGVTTVAFSIKFPSLLAVGLYDGTVNVYDVQHNSDKPLLDTEESLGKHTAPVWQLYWVEVEKGRDDDTGEVLMSISTDGRVTQWLLRKGFESNDYMKLKRILSKQTVQKRESGKDTKGPKSENLLFRSSGGLCFDVCPDDKTIYLCGTEEGLIHRCSVSYNEQYLDTYSGHTGPVYRIAWSPIAKGVFLSSSADWTVSLWTTDRFQPCITFASRKKPVFDICWSPKSATIFCCANEEAVEVWDLSKNT
ncbi:unnamed protein product [Rotaria sordida]|nr:unnamed protein product [Rotaria sordida]